MSARDNQSKVTVRERKNRGDARVGYSRPPPQHQFRPGQSGNPRGRPRGAKNESTILRETMTRKIANRSEGGRRKISVLEGIILRIADSSLKGDIKSATFLLNRYAAMVSGDLQPEDLGGEDREVLRAFARRLKDNGGAGDEER